MINFRALRKPLAVAAIIGSLLVSLTATAPSAAADAMPAGTFLLQHPNIDYDSAHWWCAHVEAAAVAQPVTLGRCQSGLDRAFTGRPVAGHAGMYQLALQNNVCLRLQKQTTDLGTPIVSAACKSSDSAQWFALVVSQYELRTVNGSCVGATSNFGAALAQTTCRPDQAHEQLWTTPAVAAPVLNRLTQAGSGYCAAVVYAKVGEGTVLADCDASADRNFYRVPVNDSGFYLALGNGVCLRASRSINGAAVVGAVCAPYDQLQIWYPTAASGSAPLQSYAPFLLCMDTQNAATNRYAPVVIGGCTQSLTQMWSTPQT
jgi:hypothetical protein